MEAQRVLVGPDCGVSSENVKGYEQKIKESETLWSQYLVQHFGSDAVKHTTTNHDFRALPKLMEELENCTHYIASEGLNPDVYQQLKERHPKLRILRVADFERTRISDTEKVSLFTQASRVEEITRFESVVDNKPEEMSSKKGTILHISGHPMQEKQREALKTLYRNGEVIQKAGTFPSVDAVIKLIGEHQDLLALHVVLPAGMVADLTQDSRLGDVKVIRSEMDRSQRPPQFVHFQWIRKTIFETKAIFST